MPPKSNNPIIELPFSGREQIKEISQNSQLLSYFELLKEENKKINLVSRETIENSLPQLALESIIPFREITTAEFKNYLDIGSGGGFPSIPNIICNNISASFLIERTEKKAKALKRFCSKLNLNVTVINENLEEIKTVNKYDLISMRLVKLTEKRLKFIKKLMSKKSIFIYYAEPQFAIPPTFPFQRYILKNLDVVKATNKSQLNPPKSFTIFNNS